MSTKTEVLVSGVLLLLTVPLTVQAAALTHRCAEQVDDAQRLACYDSEFGKPRAAVPRSAAPAPAAKPAPPEAAARPAEAVVAPKKAKPTSVASSIASLRRMSDGRQQVTLANNEVWTQLEPDPRAEMRVGDSVTVRPAALGSFMLVTASGVPTRVTRVK